MSRQVFLLALTALVIIMLVGCKEPVGVPNNDVHAATVVNCQVLYDYTGHVDLFSGYSTVDSCIDSFSPIIRRGYYEYQNRAFPRQIGFCHFDVPSFSSSSPSCTLFYYQKAHSGSPDLEVRWVPYGVSGVPRESLYWESWDSDLILASGATRPQNTWYAVPLTDDGCAKVRAIAAGGGGTLITGWVYPGDEDGIYTTPRSTGPTATTRPTSRSCIELTNARHTTNGREVATARRLAAAVGAHVEDNGT
jgi:hypothetical protein